MKEIDLREYEKEILDIWEKYKELSFLTEPRREYRKYPLLPEKVKTNTILFVGINPSFREGTMIKEKIEFYHHKKNEEKDIQYFEKFKEVARYCNELDNWEHIDLLFLRETKQKFIDELTFQPKGVEFIEKQLDISFRIIKRINPKIIIVPDALASEFFGKKKSKHKDFDKIWQGYNLDFENDFDEEIGTYKISMNNREIPIIFSGMLSGQRALDIATLERLKWQIKMILGKMK